MIISYILITPVFDKAVILKAENRSWSNSEFEGLKETRYQIAIICTMWQSTSWNHQHLVTIEEFWLPSPHS